MGERSVALAACTRREPGQAEVERPFADALNRAGMLEEAVEHYQRVTDWDANPPLLNNYGIALSALGRNAEAAQTFEKLLALDRARHRGTTTWHRCWLRKESWTRRPSIT